MRHVKAFGRMCGHAFIRWGEYIAYGHGWVTLEDIKAEDRREHGNG